MVIELGPESAAAGAKIVVEAKEDFSFNLAKALEELAVAPERTETPTSVSLSSPRPPRRKDWMRSTATETI